MGEPNNGQSFDIKYSLLPPDLHIKLWLLGLDANTSRIQLAYSPGSFSTGVAYNYGAGVEASLFVNRTTLTLGANPTNGNANFNMVFRGFNFSASTNLVSPNLGLGLSYGAGLLPMPQELTASFVGGAGALQRMAGGLGGLGDNPLAWYQMNSNDITTLSNAINAGQQIAKFGSSGNNFGAGLRLNFDGVSNFTIYGAAQVAF